MRNLFDRKGHEFHKKMSSKIACPSLGRVAVKFALIDVKKKVVNSNLGDQIKMSLKRAVHSTSLGQPLQAAGPARHIVKENIYQYRIATSLSETNSPSATTTKIDCKRSRMYPTDSPTMTFRLSFIHCTLKAIGAI